MLANSTKFRINRVIKLNVNLIEKQKYCGMSSLIGNYDFAWRCGQAKKVQRHFQAGLVTINYNGRYFRSDFFFSGGSEAPLEYIPGVLQLHPGPHGPENE